MICNLTNAMTNANIRTHSVVLHIQDISYYNGEDNSAYPICAVALHVSSSVSNTSIADTDYAHIDLPRS